MSQSLPNDGIKFDKDVKQEDLLNSPDDTDIGYFAEVDVKYLDTIKEKTKNFPFAPENKICSHDKFNAHLNRTKLEK